MHAEHASRLLAICGKHGYIAKLAWQYVQAETTDNVVYLASLSQQPLQSRRRMTLDSFMLVVERLLMQYPCLPHVVSFWMSIGAHESPHTLEFG